PTLAVEAIYRQVSATDWIVNVTSYGESSFDITSAHNSIWLSLSQNFARVRVAYYEAHNPTGGTERQGPLEASATMQGLSQIGKTAMIELSFDTDWARGGYALLDILRPGALIHLSDQRSAETNPEGLWITPDAAQLSGDGDFARVVGSTKTTTLDG